MVRRARQLTPRTLFRLAETVVYFGVSQVGFLLPPRALLGRWVQGTLGAPSGGRADRTEAARLAWIDDAVANRWPFGGRCLQRSLVLIWLLRRRGIEGQMRIGVLKGSDRMAAHAWVEVAGEPVNDTPSHCAAFEVFEAPAERLVALVKLEKAS
ncbi:MAG: lasso peptide biosynthesis B2 protein [Dehalococcoidia bacterium]